MYVSERQIEVVVKILRGNELRLSDGYDHYCGYDRGDVDEVLKEIAIDIINNLNEVIYYNAT